MRSNTKKVVPDTNRLFPVFIKLESLRVLIVGGGKVAEEKLSAILANAPQASIRLVAREITRNIEKLAAPHSIELLRKPFEPDDLSWGDIVFSAVNDVRLSKQIHVLARKRGLLHNAADKPALCDFYLGSIIQKGNLKLGISTNGKSPTIARRLKKILDEVLPGELDEVLNNLSLIRETLRGDLGEKVKQLNKLTKTFIPTQRKTTSDAKSRSRKRQ